MRTFIGPERLPAPRAAARVAATHGWLISPQATDCRAARRCSDRAHRRPCGRGEAIPGDRHGERPGRPGQCDQGAAGALGRHRAQKRRRCEPEDPQASAAGAGHADADQLRLDRWRGAGAGGHGDRSGGRVFLRGAEAAVVPEGVRLPEVPAHVGSIQGGHPPARAAGPAVERDPRPHRRARRRVSDRSRHRRVRRQDRPDRDEPRATRVARGADQDPRAGATGAERARARGELERGGTALLDRQVVRARRRAHRLPREGMARQAARPGGLPRAPRAARRPGEDAERLLRLHGRPHPTRDGDAQERAPQARPRPIGIRGPAAVAGHVRAHLHGDLDDAHDLCARVRLGPRLQQLGRDGTLGPSALQGTLEHSRQPPPGKLELPFVEVAEREPHLVVPLVADVERTARDIRDAGLGRGGAQLARVDARGQRDPREHPARRLAPGAPLRHVRVERGRQRGPVRRVQRPRARDAGVEVPGAAVLLDHPLPERARALSVFCLKSASSATIEAGPTAHPSRKPGEKIFEKVPACSTTSGPSDHSEGSGSPSKASSR